MLVTFLYNNNRAFSKLFFLYTNSITFSAMMLQAQVHLIVVIRRVGSRSTQLSFHNGDLVTQTSLNKLNTSVS